MAYCTSLALGFYGPVPEEPGAELYGKQQRGKHRVDHEAQASEGEDHSFWFPSYLFFSQGQNCMGAAGGKRRWES